MRRSTLLALVGLCVVAVPAAASTQSESVTVQVGKTVSLKTVFDKTKRYRVVMSGLVAMATKDGTLTQTYDPLHGATDGNCTNSGASVYLQIKDASGHLIDYSTAGKPSCRKDHRYEFVVNDRYPPAWDLNGKAVAYIVLQPDRTYWTVSGSFKLTISPASAGNEPAPSAATKRLQENLGKLGYYNGPFDGRDGARLRAAVKAFQRQAGIAADGECSAACEAAIRKALGVGASPAVRSVLALQAALKRLGLYDGPLDGKGSPKLDAAIKRFQIAVGIPADGTCDAQCQSALNKALGLDDPALPAGAAPTTAATVVQLQSGLRKLGFFNGPLDGKPGSALSAAVKSFQRDVGIPTDGRCAQRCQLELVKALSRLKT